MNRRILSIIVLILVALVIAVLLLRPSDESPVTLPPEDVIEEPTVRPVDPRKAIDIPERPYKVIPNELAVLLHEGVSLDEFKEAVRDETVQVLEQVSDKGRVIRVEIPAQRREELKRFLKALPIVHSVTYQSILIKNAVPNDPVFHNEDKLDDWNLHAINAPAAWDITRGSSDVIIAIVDAGTFVEHEELQGKIVAPWSFYSNSTVHTIDYVDDLVHGTHTAVTAAGSGNNGVGTSGVCPECSVMPLQANGGLTTALEGYRYAVENGARVISMSLAMSIDDDIIEDYHDPTKRAALQSRMISGMQEDAEFLAEALLWVEAENVVVVVGAANDNLPGDMQMFCRTPYTLCVGAVRLKDGALMPPRFSNYGYMVQVSAPGYEVYSGSSETTDAYILMPGTSVATPHVAGLAGLLLSKYPDMSAKDVRQAILAGAMQQPPHTPWYVQDRQVTRELALWERAFLLAVGHTEEGLTTGIAQFLLNASLPMGYSSIWDGPYATDGTDKAVGAFIDARASLELAASEAYRDQFVELSDAEIDRGFELTSERLVQIYESLSLVGSYAGSPAIGGPFQLELNAPYERLDVVRQSAPGSEYTEWFEYLKPGWYRHEATFNNDDYSQFFVHMWREDGALQIENMRAGNTISYAVAAAITDAPTAPSFCVIPGGCDPAAYGDVLVTFTGESEEERVDYYVYPSWADPETMGLAFKGETGSATNLLTGTYNIKIPIKPAIWLRDIEITADETLALQAGGFGQLLVSGNDGGGQPWDEHFFLYDPADVERNKNLVTGTTNELLELLAGTYTVRVSLKPDHIFENVDVSFGKITEVALPQWGQLQISQKDDSGALIRKSYWVYEPGGNFRDATLSSGHTDGTPISLPPGTYDAKISGVDELLTNITITASETSVINL